MCAVGQDQQTRIGVGDSSIGAGLGGGGGGGGGGNATFMGGPENTPTAPKQGWTRNPVLVGENRVRATADTLGATPNYQTPRQRDKGDPITYGVSSKLYK